MAQVPSNLIPVRVTQLMTDPAPSADGIMMYVRNGVNYSVRVGDLLAVGATLPWANITGTPTTLAGYGITDGVSTSGSYANPTWITSLDWNKLTGTPTFVSSVFGRTGAVAAAAGDYSLDQVVVPAARKIGAPTVVLDGEAINDYAWSSGAVAGFDFTDNGDGTMTFTGGTAVIRSGDVITAPLYTVSVAGATPALTDNALNLVHVNWNSGAPVVESTTNVSTVSGLSRVGLWAIYRYGNTLHELDLRAQNIDTSRRIRQLFLAFSRFIHASGGSALGGTGLALTVTAGTFYIMINPIPHPAFDTSVAGTANANVFVNWYRDGAGGWTSVELSKTIDSTVYDNNTGTPVALNNNHFGVSWVYVMNNTPSELQCVMGQGNYNTLALAQAATPPASLPGILAEFGSLIGVVIYEKSAAAFADVRSAFTQALGSSVATAHNGLAGLQGGALNDYYHMTATEYAGSGTGVFARINSPALTGSVGGITGGTF